MNTGVRTMQYRFIALLALPLATMIAGCAHSQSTQSTQPAATSGPASIPMKSRTCGLVLLSEGRSQVRANDMDRGLSSLIGAFALLQDGRLVEDKTTARTASQKMLNGSPQEKAAALTTCQQWLDVRKAQPGFANTEADRWNWAAQAQMTAQTESRPSR